MILSPWPRGSQQRKHPAPSWSVTLCSASLTVAQAITCCSPSTSIQFPSVASIFWVILTHTHTKGSPDHLHNIDIMEDSQHCWLFRCETHIDKTENTSWGRMVPAEGLQSFSFYRRKSPRNNKAVLFQNAKSLFLFSSLCTKGPIWWLIMKWMEK